MKLTLKIIISSILLITFSVLEAATLDKNRPARPQTLKRHNALGEDDNQHGNRRIGIHSGNKIFTRFTNYGSIADYTVPSRFDSGIYPIGSGRSYLAEFSPIVAAETPNAAGGKAHVVSEGTPVSSDNPVGSNYLWQFEPRLGYANANDSLIAMSDDSLSWPDSWPDLPSDWDNKWAGQYGQYNRADQESYFHMDDFNNDEFKHYPVLVDQAVHAGEIVMFAEPDSDDYAILTDMTISFEGLVRDVERASALSSRDGRRPDAIRVLDNDDNIFNNKWYEIDSLIDNNTVRLKAFSGRAATMPAGTEYQIYDGFKRGVGVDVAARGYQWAHPAAEDILIFTYWIQNISSWDYEKFIFGMYGDADVGDENDVRDDDAWFDTQNDIVYQWDHDMWSNTNGGFIPAYFGWKYLESPGNPLDEKDNDEDGMIDESQDDGIDNDGDWDPYVDDTGADGIGPNFGEYVGPDADGTEGNGVPDPGEPNFEYTDNDESDQIGLTSFTAGPWPGIDLTRDEDAWGKLAPGSFTDIHQTVDLTFMYGSAYFELPVQEERKFSVALIFGNDYEDILRNSETMQQIYDSDYNFAKPPNLPKLTVVPGDGQVTLYWDDKAELSVDPIYGMDFEGYRIYRATDPAFNEIWNITDTYGNQTFNKPIAQFDKADGLVGPHPYGLNGIHLDMGTDTGLRHSWVDNTVENGQTYYYAVVSYDYGFDHDFYERGISDVELRPIITPSECTKKIEINASGTPVKFAINTGVAVPNAPAMAYVAPEIIPDDATSLGTGSYEVTVIDPSEIHANDQYQITFHDWSEDGIDNDNDWATWVDENTVVELSPTLDIIIPASTDTLHINLNEVKATYNITESTTRFEFANFEFVTTFVDTQTITSEDATFLQYFVLIPDTSFTVLPSLGIWDGWEPLNQDVGADGCTDEYETGNPNSPCSETALNLGGDPNQDNWDPVNNPTGTQANAKPDLGEPNIDVNDIDELARVTTSYALTNLSSGKTLLSDRQDLSGEARGLVTEGFKVNITNDETMLIEEETGWMTPGLNFEIVLSDDRYNNFPHKSVPFDYLVTVHPSVVDTSIDNRRLAFNMHDLTNDKPVRLLASGVRDSVMKAGHTFYSTITAGDEFRVTWKMSTRAKVGDINDITKWDDLIICATSGQGLGVYDGESWSNITTAAGLASNHINDLAFSNNGTLLLGTASGLNVYSGLGWRTYAMDMVIGGNAENDKSDFISFDKVIEDSEGILWSVSTKGVLRWDWNRSNIAHILGENSITTIDWAADTFATAEDDSILTGIVQEKSIDIVDLGNGTLAIGTSTKGLELYNTIDDSITLLNKDNSDLNHNSILSLAVSGDSLYIGTKSGLNIYNIPDSSFVFSRSDSLIGTWINDIFVTADQHVHLATRKGYAIVDLMESDSVNQIQYFTGDDVPEFNADKIQAVAKMDDGSIWLGTENSVARKLDGEWEDWAPKPGDQYIIKSKKPFSALDTLTFTTQRAMIDHAVDSDMLEDISVVPNPYVVTASWEPQHLYESGRGTRKIDFIHLPPECTIRIYTISGKYVDTIEHNSEIWDGAESWDLLSQDGLEIAFGVYLYHVDAPGIGNHISKFAVIK